MEHCLEDTFYWWVMMMYSIQPSGYDVCVEPFLKRPQNLYIPNATPRCLNPNSGDTGGLLDYDFTTPMPDKLQLLDRVQPNPTFIAAKGAGQLCIQPGAYANPKCDKGRRLQRG